jgi:hypothetical protein
MLRVVLSGSGRRGLASVPGNMTMLSLMDASPQAIATQRLPTSDRRGRLGRRRPKPLEFAGYNGADVVQAKAESDEVERAALVREVYTRHRPCDHRRCLPSLAEGF